MNRLVRGAAVLSLIGVFVAYMYAQASANTGNVLTTTRVSQPHHDGSSEVESTAVQTQQAGKDQKLVKKTGLVSASKGAFTATAYCLKGRTAMGHGVRRGIIAADPRVLKLGKTVLLNAGAYSGQYLVSDTGGAVRGRKIDIWVPSCAEARRFGRRTISVSLVE
ncbi:MAG: 3D domain-containing protein [Pyrinomonadaceae bacterium]